MPRSLLLPLTMMLLIATAMAMLASAMLFPRSDAMEFSVAGSTEVVERFYAAANETIATGNLETLRHVVKPSFADENPLPGVRPGRTGLEDYLVTLHHADPGLRLEAEVLSASADQVATQVQVRAAPVAASMSAGFSARRAVWSPIELFRITDGVIVRRWGQTDGLTLARPLAVQTLELPFPTPRVVSLLRVTQAPGTRWDAPPVAGPRLLVLQAGVLEIQAEPGSAGDVIPTAGAGAMASQESRTDASRRVMLTAGATWLAPARAMASTTSVGSTDAQLLVVAFSEPQIPNGAVPDVERLPAGVTVQVLAGDLATTLGAAPVTVTLEQIALARAADLQLSSTDGPILVAVETGQLTATAWGTAWVRRHRDGMSVASREDILTTENGMLVQPGGIVALRNGEQGPAHVLVVTIQRMEADRGP